jgi:hypothetical protein
MQCSDLYRILEAAITSSTSILNQSAINIDRLAAAGKEMDRGGLTKAGRGLMKHGYRKDSVFPKPTGNPAQINEHGQKMLEFILYHPEKVVYERSIPQYGTVIDMMVPEHGGVRFKNSGEMIGFLEPKR